MRRLTLSFVLFACLATLAHAQSKAGDDYPRFEFFAGYSANGYFKDDENLTIMNLPASRFFTDEAGGTRGFETSVARNVNRRLGFKADFSAYFNNHVRARGTFGTCVGAVCTQSTQDFKVNSRALYFLFGPELKARNHTRVTPFAHALFGIVNSHSKFSTSGATITFADSSTNNGFASAFGGGIDIRATRRVSLRLLADYAPTFLREADTGSRRRQDHVRLSLGILFH